MHRYTHRPRAAQYSTIQEMGGSSGGSLKTIWPEHLCPQNDYVHVIPADSKEQRIHACTMITSVLSMCESMITPMPAVVNDQLCMHTPKTGPEKARHLFLNVGVHLGGERGRGGGVSA